MSQAHILVVDDEPDIRELVREILEDEGYAVSVARNGETARMAWVAESPDLVLLDIWMPDVDGITLLKEWSNEGSLACPVVVMSGHGTLETAVEATRLGAHDFVQKPLSLAKLLATVSKALEARSEKPAATRQALQVAHIQPVGNSAVMQLLRQKAEQAARHASTVLITGESGSGRENLAHHIHHLAAPRGELVTLDHYQLGSGHAREYLMGSEDGAQHTSGVLERAAAGTLYIPELQNLDSDAQALLNQVLESGTFVREGGTTPQQVSCRLIVSAARDAVELVSDGSINEQLYFRINILPLAVPALRERAEDVPELVRFYAEWFPNHENLPYRSFSVSAQNRLRNHDWPGNIRELRNLVQRLLILGGNEDVTAVEVEDALRQNPAPSEAAAIGRNAEFDMPLREAREQFERNYLLYQLEKAGGSVGKLSQSAGMERTHLYRKLRSLGIDPKSLSQKRGNQ
jgi:two-component system nitrogen regulation response regulator NtrX